MRVIAVTLNLIMHKHRSVTLGKKVYMDDANTVAVMFCTVVECCNEF